MAKAYQCDRCGKLVAGSNSNVISQYGYVGKELCDECFEEYKMFMSGADIGMNQRTIAEMENTLEYALTFTETGILKTAINKCLHLIKNPITTDEGT